MELSGNVSQRGAGHLSIEKYVHSLDFILMERSFRNIHIHICHVVNVLSYVLLLLSPSSHPAALCPTHLLRPDSEIR